MAERESKADEAVTIYQHTTRKTQHIQTAVVTQKCLLSTPQNMKKDLFLLYGWP